MNLEKNIDYWKKIIYNLNYNKTGLRGSLGFKSNETGGFC